MKRVFSILLALMLVVAFITVATKRDNGLTIYQQLQLEHTNKKIVAATADDPVGATLLYFDAVLRGDPDAAKSYLSSNTEDIRISMQHRRLEESLKMQLAFVELFGVEKEELVAFSPSHVAYTSTSSGQPAAHFDLKVVSRRLFRDEVDVMVSYWRITAIQEKGKWKVLDPAYVDGHIRTYTRTSW